MADSTHRVGDEVVAECTSCHQRTNIMLRERKSMMGFKKEKYWSCERCGNRQSRPPD
jgi:hypothetical protein